MNAEAENFGRGLIDLGLRSQIDNVAFFSETRAEWLISAYGCIKQSIPVVTLHADLGEEALVHGINETKVKCVILSQELLHKLKNMLPLIRVVSTIVNYIFLH